MPTTNKKPTPRKPATAKKAVKAEVETSVEEVVEAAPVVEKVPAKKVAKKYAADELIPCRSVTAGELLYYAKKSGLMYVWSNCGDITEVEFQDLQALKSQRSGYLMKPFFVIEDEELLSQPGWSDLKKLYISDFTDEDIENILALPITTFKNTLIKLPKGMKTTLASVIAERVENGSFDSINKIRAADEVLGTELLITLK